MTKVGKLDLPQYYILLNPESKADRVRLGLPLIAMETRFFYIYILFSLKDRKFYTGYTENLKIRLSEHFQGKVKSTINRRPLTLIYYEAFTDIKDAKARERFLKSGFGREQMKKSLRNKLKELRYKHLKS